MGRHSSESRKKERPYRYRGRKSWYGTKYQHRRRSNKCTEIKYHTTRCLDINAGARCSQNAATGATNRITEHMLNIGADLTERGGAQKRSLPVTLFQVKGLCICSPKKCTWPDLANTYMYSLYITLFLIQIRPASFHQRRCYQPSRRRTYLQNSP